MKQENSNHELDLNFVKENGFLTNNEVKLDEKRFLTKEKISHFGNVITRIFKNDEVVTSLDKR